jgi:transposase
MLLLALARPLLPPRRRGRPDRSYACRRACDVTSCCCFAKHVLKRIWADAAYSAYRGQEVADWCKAHGDWELEVVERTPGVRGCAVLPKRWMVERTFGWLSRNRRLSKDDEGKVQTSETLIEVAMIRLLIARQGRPA